MNDGLKIDTLETYLSILANYRNLCAHEDILYEHRTQRRIPNDKVHDILNIDRIEGEYLYGKNDLFAVIIIMKYMLSKEDFMKFSKEISNEIEILDEKINVVPLSDILNSIGFPTNWKDIQSVD